ncbi:MAG: 16S rRNA (adenine(1518)-N(6)/adenine(1519)-N(6))-dimethyltransferase RsmA [Candidatus Micrarchaeia archaeon]
MKLMEIHALNPKSIKANKKLGQHFLLDERVAELEASFGKGKGVIEIGPGLGMLTSKLCKYAKSVLAIEMDKRLCDALASSLQCDNLSIINSDFFEVEKSELSGYEIIISNVPYMLSSKIIEWLTENELEAVLCLQKEFVERMLATVGDRKYSRLSVMTTLILEVEQVAEVKAEQFYPKPKVDSAIVHIKPKGTEISQREKELIKLLMEHKKKTLRNAIIDSSKALGISKDQAKKLFESLGTRNERIFRTAPKDLLGIASAISQKLELLK